MDIINCVKKFIDIWKNSEMLSLDVYESQYPYLFVKEIQYGLGISDKDRGLIIHNLSIDGNGFIGTLFNNNMVLFVDGGYVLNVPVKDINIDDEINFKFEM